jgi:diguanylate cyclase (GGDEF)-like protein
LEASWAVLACSAGRQGSNLVLASYSALHARGRTSRPGVPALIARPGTSLIDEVAGELYLRREALAGRTLRLLRRRSPDYVRRLREHGEDPHAITAGVVDLLVRCLSSDAEAIAREMSEEVREAGRRRCGQGLALDSLIDVLALQKQVFMEEFEALAARHDDTGSVVFAMRSLDHLVERLTLDITRGYLGYVEDRYHEEHRELRALISIARAVNESLELEEAAESGLRETLRATGLDSAALWTVARDGRLVLTNTIGLSKAQEAKLGSWHLEGNEYVMGVLDGVTPVPMRAITEITGLDRDRSVIMAPLRSKGRLVGLMAVGTSDTERRRFSDADITFVGAVADHFALALEHAEQHQREARTDYLTGLSNRPEFERAIERESAAAERYGRPLSLLLLDLDGLKGINDNHGHHAGDEAIRAVAEAIRSVVRVSDTCARMGGDEFAVAMPEAELAQAEEVANRIGEALDAISRSGRLGTPAEISVGVAQLEAGMGWVDLFEEADARLYREKRRRSQARRLRA